MTTAFVLFGGGSLGAVQVGMLAALAERGFQPDLLVGASAGALNSAFVAGRGFSTDTIDELARVWRRVRRTDVFPFAPHQHLLALAGVRSALCSPGGLRRLIRAHITYGRLEEFRGRPLGHVEFPYVFADATYIKGRVRGRVVSRAVVIATGVTATGDREVIGVDVGDSEHGAFWAAFFKGLRARGLDGVQLVISDDHLGLSRRSSRCSSAPAGNARQCTIHLGGNRPSKHHRLAGGSRWSLPAGGRGP